jgi:hypothetical protein
MKQPSKEQWDKFHSILKELDEAIRLGEFNFMSSRAEDSLDLIYSRQIAVTLMFLIQKEIL